MTREEKIEKRKLRSIQRAIKNGNRNRDRFRRSSNNCPFDVEMHGSYGTCRCGGERIAECAADV